LKEGITMNDVKKEMKIRVNLEMMVFFS